MAEVSFLPSANTRKRASASRECHAKFANKKISGIAGWTLLCNSFLVAAPPAWEFIRELKKPRRRRRGQRRLKNELIFYLRISRYSEVIYLVYLGQSCHETESRTHKLIWNRNLKNKPSGFTCTAIVLLINLLFSDVAAAVAVVDFLSSLLLTAGHGEIRFSIEINILLVFVDPDEFFLVILKMNDYERFSEPLSIG